MPLILTPTSSKSTKVYLPYFSYTYIEKNTFSLNKESVNIFKAFIHKHIFIY